MNSTELVSPNAKCRALGCQTHVPWYGGYPGMSQSHCTRCGMRTHYAQEGVEDFVEPHYPESDWYYRWKEKISEWWSDFKWFVRKPESLGF